MHARSGARAEVGEVAVGVAVVAIGVAVVAVGVAVVAVGAAVVAVGVAVVQVGVAVVEVGVAVVALGVAVREWRCKAAAVPSAPRSAREDRRPMLASHRRSGQQHSIA